MQTTMEQFQNVPVKRLFWKLSIPAMPAQFLNILYGIVNTWQQTGKMRQPQNVCQLYN